LCLSRLYSILSAGPSVIRTAGGKLWQKFKAAVSKDSVTRRAQLPEQRQRIDHLIDHYLQQLDQADNDDQHIELESASIKEALKQLQQKKTALIEVEALIDERGRNQACITEPDAKLMRSG
jgi:transposase